jgi:hypothetical protein
MNAVRGRWTGTTVQSLMQWPYREPCCVTRGATSSHDSAFGGRMHSRNTLRRWTMAQLRSHAIYA